ncbi:nucleoid-associated protein [Paraclostridium tenue]|uniref:Nucleoid-associated protein n=1 Tax=Paraclostridium tenue TaxID=1737 RepID=A0ABN1LY53_9FIRM
MEDLLCNLNIESIIAHKVLKRRSSEISTQPIYNEDIIMLNDAALFTFNQRVIQAIGSDSNSIEMDIYNKNEDSVFNSINDIVENGMTNFVDESKKIALKLADAQNTIRIPGGIIFIFNGKIGEDENQFVGVMKAETQDGFSIVKNEDQFTLDHITELLLTPHQKLYKIGMFIKVNEEYKCIVYDSNLGRSANSDAAKYFYETFLGCRQAQNSKYLTKQFYIETKGFIEKEPNLTEEEKFEANSALNTYVKLNQSNIISTREFADTYLKDDINDNYTNHMRDVINFPEVNVMKDISLIEKNLKKMKIKFTDNINLVGPTEDFSRVVSISKDGDDTLVRIKGYIVGQE